MRLIILFFFIFLYGCSSDPYEKYVGYWSNKDNQYEMLEISKDGDTYLLNKPMSKGSKEVLLSKSEGQLMISPGIGALAISISENGDKIYAMNDQWLKISESDFKKIYLDKYENYDKYVGFWSLEPSKHNSNRSLKRVIEIKKQNEDYYLSNPIDKNSTDELLNKSDGQLFLGDNQLRINDEKNNITYYIKDSGVIYDQKTWSKIDKSEFEAKLKEIEADRQAEEEKLAKQKAAAELKAAQKKEEEEKARLDREATAKKRLEDKAACSALRAEFDNRRKQIMSSPIEYSERAAKRSELIQEYKTKLMNRGISDCSIGHL